jgi:hypothetical protein
MGKPYLTFTFIRKAIKIAVLAAMFFPVSSKSSFTEAKMRPGIFRELANGILRTAITVAEAAYSLISCKSLLALATFESTSVVETL